MYHCMEQNASIITGSRETVLVQEAGKLYQYRERGNCIIAESRLELVSFI